MTIAAVGLVPTSQEKAITAAAKAIPPNLSWLARCWNLISARVSCAAVSSRSALTWACWARRVEGSAIFFLARIEIPVANVDELTTTQLIACA